MLFHQKSVTRRIMLPVILWVVLTTLMGCGKKGPLSLPDAQLKQTTQKPNEY